MTRRELKDKIYALAFELANDSSTELALGFIRGNALLVKA